MSKKLVLKLLLTDTFEQEEGNIYLTDEGRKLVKRIGTTSVVSKDYDPNCMVSYVEMFIHTLRLIADGPDENNAIALQNFIKDADCVDKGVIAEMVAFGNMANYKWALIVVKMLAMMLLGDTKRLDTRVALATRSGLIEMCLSFIERSRELEQQTLPIIWNIFQLVFHISLQRKTAKAITYRRDKIEGQLKRIRNIRYVANNTKCKELLDMISSILGMSGAYCCRCNKLLGRKERKQCGGCNRMTYCTVACQKEDWLNGGHASSCGKEYTGEQQLCQYQGRTQPRAAPETDREAMKVKELEINVTMIQLKLLLDQSKSILGQARSMNVSLYDAVVIFDLRSYPRTVEVKKYADFYSSIGRGNWLDDSQSKDNITCIYLSNWFEGGLDNHANVPCLVMQRLFPHKWLLSYPTPVA